MSRDKESNSDFILNTWQDGHQADRIIYGFNPSMMPPTIFYFMHSLIAMEWELLKETI